MKHGLIDPTGKLHELHMYQIEGLCKAMMTTAIKDEKELMDFIDPHNQKHRTLMAKYAVSLSERFEISIFGSISSDKLVKKLQDIKNIVINDINKNMLFLICTPLSVF